MPAGSRQLATVVREARESRGWTQEELAAELNVSVDAVRRLEGDRYPLPTRQRAGGHSLEKVLTGLGFDVCEVMRSCFGASDLERTVYRRCIGAASAAKAPATRTRPGSLQEYIDQLPATKASLLEQAAILNAHAMAFLISLERIFDRFEFLVTNQPPFVLFADQTYVTEGSSSTELGQEDRQTYHHMIFSHQRDMRARVRDGRKHYKVVLHQDPLIEFLAHRSFGRAQRIVADMQSFLRFPSFDMVILDQTESSDEFEILVGHYPYSHVVSGDAVSVRHRRVGIGNTALYQLSLIGLDDQLVAEDHARADAMWRRALADVATLPTAYAEFRSDQYATRRTRIVARALDDALLAAHPHQRNS